MNLESQKFTIAVIATMSAGKSTTLNAILGLPLLATKNEACTAILTKIGGVDNAEEILARTRSHNGEESMWEVINAENSELIAQWNSTENHSIEIQSNFPHIDSHSKKIEFIDTPGPNNSRDKNHSDITRDIISSGDHSYIIFVINATQFGVDDEKILLESVFDALSKNGKHKKIVFVVNKADQLDVDAGEIPAQLIATVKEYLESIGFRAPIVLLVMSQLSLDIRRCLNAHRNGLALPFSPRVQKKLFSQITELLYSFQLNLETLSNSGDKNDDVPQFVGQSNVVECTDLLAANINDDKKWQAHQLENTDTPITVAPEFEVYVFATMSAGKSTVINAMLGKELMPSKNKACTATIAKIRNFDDMHDFKACRFGHEGQLLELDTWTSADLNLISKWNNDSDTSTIEIKGNIPAINECDGVRLVLVDTPGPNNSRDESHQQAIMRAVKEKQPFMVLYVLNATQLSTNDDKNLLAMIKEVMAEGGREAQDRFIFLANKIDCFNVEQGESISTVLTQVKKYLKDNGIVNPFVIPVSAELAKLLRIAESNGAETLTRKQRNDLNSAVDLFVEQPEMNMLEHVRPDMDSSIYLSLKEKLDAYKTQHNNLKVAEILSGIPILEAVLSSVISKYANPAQPKGTVVHLENIADNSENKIDYLNRIFGQNSQVQSTDLLTFADSQLSIDQLIEADFLSGIPLLEKILSNKIKGNKLQAPRLKITYNPFTVVTQFEMNGEAITKGSLHDKTQNRRLQQWIDKILPVIAASYNTSEIQLTFEGTELDAGDVRAAIKQYQADDSSMRIIEKYVTSTVSADDKVTMLKALFEKAQKGPFDEFRSEKMHKAFEKALAPEFEVHVLATMSAGKSTVINAMLGKELMPSKNEACTATIARIHDHDGMDHFEARRYNSTGELLDDWTTADSSLINLWNSDPDTFTIEIKGNIPAINERDGVRLVLVDTPGPNNSRDESHQLAMMCEINNKQPSMVLYVLNATQLSTNDDRNLLTTIKEVMRKGGREAQDRFIFLANKIDTFDPEKGESVKTALTNVKKYLNDNGITNPFVIPVSAELTKLLRIAEYNGKLTTKQIRNLKGFVELFVDQPEMNMLEHIKADMDTSTYRELKNQLNIYKSQENHNKTSEILSGIPILESMLDSYISKHAIPARLKDAIDSFKEVADSIKAIEIENEIFSSSEKIKEITASIEEFQTDEGRIKRAQEYCESVTALEYSLSEKYANQRDEISIQKNILLSNFKKQFNTDIKPSHASNLLKEAERECNFLVNQLKLILTENLQDELVTTLEKLRNDYQSYISKILNSSFPGENGMDLAREFQSASLHLPDTSAMINQFTYEKKGTKFVGTERYGFLWLNKRNIYKKTKEDLVDMLELGDKLTQSLMYAFIDNYELYEKSASANLEILKTIILRQIIKIDEKLTNTLFKMKTAMNDKTIQEEMIAENKRKIDWFIDFQANIDVILSIK